MEHDFTQQVAHSQNNQDLHPKFGIDKGGRKKNLLTGPQSSEPPPPSLWFLFGCLLFFFDAVIDFFVLIERGP